MKKFSAVFEVKFPTSIKFLNYTVTTFGFSNVSYGLLNLFPFQIITLS